MKTIKIIDLLNKIANNEIEQGTKFRMLCYEYIYNNGYIAKTDANKTIENFYISQRMLNDEVEIIEEEKESEVKEIQKIKSKRFSRNQKQIAGKINELIDAFNELKRNK